MTSAANLVLTDRNATHLVDRSTTARTYLNPSVETDPGLYRLIAIARNGVDEIMGTNVVA